MKHRDRWRPGQHDLGDNRGSNAAVGQGLISTTKLKEKGSETLITCFIRYTINPEQLGDFDLYAQVWMRLIEKYGGTHHGYFVPGDAPPSAPFSFPGLGEDGPENVAVALFSFPSVESYEKYRKDVKDDPECIAITNHRDESQCFTSYERTFMKPVARSQNRER